MAGTNVEKIAQLEYNRIKSEIVLFEADVKHATDQLARLAVSETMDPSKKLKLESYYQDLLNDAVNVLNKLRMELSDLKNRFEYCIEL